MTTGQPLAPEELEALRRFSSPTIANAIESFGVRPNNRGFSGPEIQCRFPDLGVMVGYAATVRIAAEAPGDPGHGSDGYLRRYWQAILEAPKPTVVVVEDTDPAPVGALIGEVNANLYRAMGCVGTVMNGAVRDLPEMFAAGFHAFTAAVAVSRANLHIVDFGTPVRIGRLDVSPGDLIHADRHGVLVVPHEIAREVPRVAAEIERLERELLGYAREEAVTVDGLAAVWQDVSRRMPKPGDAMVDPHV